jgi:hypothetical protein
MTTPTPKPAPKSPETPPAPHISEIIENDLAVLVVMQNSTIKTRIVETESKTITDARYEQVTRPAKSSNLA